MLFFPLPARTQVRGPGLLQRRRGLRIARAFGIDIALDVSWFIIIFIVVLSFHAQFRALFGNHLADGALWAAAILEGLLFFSSVLIHELSHSLVARRKGVEVHGITLFVFGGVSELKGEPSKAGDEFLIAGVGPLTSLVLGAVFWAIAFLLPRDTLPRTMFSWLSAINVMLAVFNLLPGLPLDGGRVLRSLVWKATGSMSKATRVSAVTGMVIAYGLILLGAILFFGRGWAFNGLWLAFIGWFLLSAAQSSVANQRAREILTRRRVGQVLRADCSRVPSSETIQSFVDERLLRSGDRCFIVTDNEALAGLVTLRDVRQVSRPAWPSTTLSEVMVPLDRIHHVSPSDSLLSAMELMNRSGVNQLAVLEDGHFAGIVSRGDVLRAVALDLELGDSEGKTPA
jgi:Zn-dependent protease/CBS domain-containing protein